MQHSFVPCAGFVKGIVRSSITVQHIGVFVYFRNCIYHIYMSSCYMNIIITHVMIKIIHVVIYKIVRSGAKCIASLYCYKLLATCKNHAVVV